MMNARVGSFDGESISTGKLLRNNIQTTFCRFKQDTLVLILNTHFYIF